MQVEPATVLSGSPTRLSWWTPVRTQVSVTGLGVVDSPGSAIVTPTQTTTYRASVVGGSNDGSATVDVIQKATFNEKIKHIVIYLNENRSFDQYFGKLGEYRQKKGIPGYVDGFNPGVELEDPFGHKVKPYKMQSVCHENVSPSWNESHYSMHRLPDGTFLMDRFMLNGLGGPETYDTHKTRAMGYYDETDLNYYYELASHFAISDRFFSSLPGPTPPNRRYLFTGTSAGQVHRENVAVGEWTQKTIFESLNEKGITWKYYYQDDSVFLANFSIWNDEFSRGLVRPVQEYYDILSRPTADQEFAQVVFIERAGRTGLDEHPLDNIQPGAARTKQLIDALMNSAIWHNSVFIYTYDEGGGLYDHVPPYQVVAPDDIAPRLNEGDLPGDFTLSGFRVPFVMISPWVKKHFVSHVNREFTSILAFIQARFDIPPLTRRDAAADNMLEFFDFRAPQLLQIPPLPAQRLDGLCSYQAAIEPGHPMN